jgi:hypothetical protein
MRLSEWAAAAPNRDAASARVFDVVRPVLAALGAEVDPHAWVMWGEDPAVRYLIMAISPVGLVMCHVRVNVPGEGVRASAKLVRWSRVQVGELDVEAGGGHRLVSVQVEQQVLRAMDAEVNRVSGFVLALLAAIDGRPMPDPDAVAAPPATGAPQATGASAETGAPAATGATPAGG